MRFPAAIATALLPLLVAAGPATAGSLVINSNASDPAPRTAWETAIARFQQENRDIKVEFSVYDHESYKKALRNWLTGVPPDVVFWFAGNRMREFALPGLLSDVSELFTPDVRASLSASALDLVTADGRQYGIPYTQYHVGLYYRRDLIERAGLSGPPRNWPALLDACSRLREIGIDPVAIGSKNLWPTAAWFDYLDLRTNGLAYHSTLMRGRVPYTDAGVRAVFARWRELLERGCFNPHHASLTWQESQSALYRGTAAMMLIGDFIVPFFSPDVRDRMDVAAFPRVVDEVGRFEEAPTNSLHVPVRAKNKEEAKRFLAYALRADVQEALNDATLLIPVNLRAAVPKDRFLQKSQALLAQANGLAQYFDRDTSEDLALVAMKGFQEFMINPSRLDDILDTIERARQRIYKN